MNDNISDSIHEVLTMLECAKMNIKSNGGLLYENDLYYPFIEGVTTREEADALVKSLSELIETTFKAGRNY
jgi:hypothetical protein